MTKKLQSLPLRVGLVGCGNISNAYFKGIIPFPDLVQIVACSDMDLTRAQAKAKEHGVAKACSVSELLNDPEVDLILNLTIPAAHAEVNLQALQAGKHAYCEKPFSLTYEEGAKVVEEAQKRGLRVGCAPDTVLGGGIQTCRKLIDDGAIGSPTAATANMLCPGHESWHPAPEFYYQPGGGPLFDMGPYYLTSLVTMFGPIEKVIALAKATFQERLITSQPLNGQKIKVNTPTHLAGVVEFVNGEIATVTMSFDVGKHSLPRLEIYGTEGSIQCPDPNNFEGDVFLWKKGQKDWEKIPLAHQSGNGRGLGLADFALALRDDRPHRMNGEIGLHVVEAMEAFLSSALSGQKIALKSKPGKPAALPAGIKA
jgi:predicted dehydrogenase